MRTYFLAASQRLLLLHSRTLATATTTPHSSAATASDTKLLLKFSELLKHLPNNKRSSNKGDSSSDLLTGDHRPLQPDPFHYTNLMKQFVLSGHTDRALHLFDEMKQYACRPDLACYTTVIDALVTAGRPMDAVAVFLEMDDSGIAPDTACFTVLVKMYSWYLKQFECAYQVIQWMIKCGCSPDVVTYSTIITGLSWEGRVEEALGVLDQMLEDDCRPNVHTFTPIVHAYCAAGKLTEATRLLDTMERVGCQPNTVTYNIIIEGLCRHGCFDEVSKQLKNYKVKGWEPDAISYSIYLDALCKCGQVDEALRQLDVMLENGLCPTSVTLNILLDCLCRGPKVWEAKCMLERSADLQWDADVVNYNTVMNRLCKRGKWASALKLFIDMFKKGINSNTRTFSILILCLCKGGKLTVARSVIRSRGFAANVVSHTTLLRYFYLAGEIEEVNLLFSEMVAENITPNAITYGIMIECLCAQGKFSEAIIFFQRSIEDGYFSVELVACLLFWLVRVERYADVIGLLDEMLQHGLVVDFSMSRSLINAFCNSGFRQRGNINQICHFLDKMLCSRLWSYRKEAGSQLSHHHLREA